MAAEETLAHWTVKLSPWNSGLVPEKPQWKPKQTALAPVEMRILKDMRELPPLIAELRSKSTDEPNQDP